MEQWFLKKNFTASVNGRTASSIWDECITRYHRGSLPSAVVGAERPHDFTEVGVASTSSSRHMTAVESRDDDDIDALLSAAGRFVCDQKTFTSSVIGSQVGAHANPQSLQGDVSVPSHRQQPSVNLRGDSHALTCMIHHEAAAANESSSSSSLTANNNCSRDKPVHHASH